MKSIKIVLIILVGLYLSGCASHISRGFGTHHYLVPDAGMLFPGVQLHFNNPDELTVIDGPLSFVWDTALLIPDLINIPFDDYGENNLPKSLPNKNDALEPASPAR